jgi:hypothetical protein
MNSENTIPPQSVLNSFYSYISISNPNIYNEWYKSCDKQQCPVCLDDVINDEKNAIICEKGHIAACNSCSIKLKDHSPNDTKCPVCRQSINIPSESEKYTSIHGYIPQGISLRISKKSGHGYFEDDNTKVISRNIFVLRPNLNQDNEPPPVNLSSINCELHVLFKRIYSNDYGELISNNIPVKFKYSYMTDTRITSMLFAVSTTCEFVRYFDPIRDKYLVKKKTTMKNHSNTIRCNTTFGTQLVTILEIYE